MEFHSFDEIVQCVRDYDNAKDALRELEQQDADVVSQIAGQEAQHEAEARAERTKARQVLRNIDQEFKEKESELQKKLKELRTKRDQDKARVQHQDDQLHQRFEDAVSALRTKHQDIVIDIKKCEERIEVSTDPWAYERPSDPFAKLTCLPRNYKSAIHARPQLQLKQPKLQGMSTMPPVVRAAQAQPDQVAN